MPDETLRNRNDSLFRELESERSGFLTHWKDIAEHTFTRRLRQFTSDRNKGEKRNQKIINNTPVLAGRTLRSGMMSGNSSPARPWFRLSTPDPGLAEFGPVKAWLHAVTDLIRELWIRSNFYNSLHTIYGDIGLFATGAMSMEGDREDILRTYSYPIGTYMVALNDRLKVDTFLREYPITVRQLVMKFGDPTAGPNDRWKNISVSVRNMWDRSDYEKTVDVRHVIRPNLKRDDSKLEARFKPFSSVYYEKGNGDQEQFLRESGFDEFPILLPRWDVTDTDSYGGDCPGMQCLGDMKALQTLEKKKSKAIDKMIDPPMTGPTGLRNQGASLLPGDITYYDVREGQQGFKPAHEVRFPVADVAKEIREHEFRIKRTFYEDLFLLLASTDRREITAREVEEKHEEKLLALGPVLERMNDELYDPAIDRTFAMASRAGLLPIPPRELEGVNLKVEYISIMAQAQKLVGLASIDRFIGFVGQAAQYYPAALDKVDIDQTIDEYADITGVPPNIVVDDNRVRRIREARDAAAAAQREAEAAAQQAENASKLSQADLGNDNVLTRLLEQTPAPGP